MLAILMATSASAMAQSPLLERKREYVPSGHKEKNSAQLLRNVPKTVEGISAERIRTRRSVMPTQKPVHKIAHAPSSESNMYGYSAWSATGDPIGMYAAGDDGLTLLWPDEYVLQTNLVMNSGFYLEGKLYGFNTTSMLGLIVNEGWIVMDMDNGEVLTSEVWDLNEDPTWTRMTYNPNDGHIYGQAWLPAQGEGDTRPFVYLKAPLDNPTDYEVICNIPGDEGNMSSVCFNEVENVLYAINIKGDLIKITTEGDITTLFPIGLESYGFDPAYFFGMVYNPTDNLIHFCPVTSSGSYLATINVAAQSVDVYHEIEHGNQLMFMTTKNQWVKDREAPQSPTINEISFPEGSSSGSIVYGIPSETVNGETISGNLTAYAKIDNQDYTEYEVEPGSTLKVEYSNLAYGRHSFSLQVVKGEHASLAMTNSLWIGNDTPLAPANVTLSDTQVTWEPVTAGVHNGYLNLPELTYTVKINGKECGTTSDSKLDINLPEDAGMQVYRAEVTCAFGDLVSETTVSNPQIAGGAWSLPVYIKPTSDDFMMCTVIDGNNDGKVWKYWIDQGFATNFSDPEVMNDDWLILPPVKIDSPDKYIKLAFDINRMSTAFPEEFIEVYAGTAPTAEAMTTVVMERFQPEIFAPSFGREETLFKVPAAGDYYIGFHWISEPMMDGMFLKNINIEDNNVTDHSPEAPTAVSAVAHDNGVLKATVTLTLPTKTLEGNDIPAETVLTANVRSEVGTASVGGRPGETVSVVVDTKQSNNTLLVTASLDGLNSPEATADIYTGVVCPETPVMKRYEVKPDMSGFTMEWEPVTTGIDNGYINPETVKYCVYKLTQEWYGSVWADAELDMTKCSFSYDINPGDPMELASYGVTSNNEAGTNGQITYIQAIIGTPYTVPVEETFKNGQYSFQPWIIYKPTDEYNAQWGLTKMADAIVLPGVDENAYAMAGIGEDTKGKLGMPRFSTVGEDGVTLTFDYLNGPNWPTVKLYAEYYGCEEPIAIGEITATSTEHCITTVDFNLPDELMGKDWVQIYLETEFTGSDKVVLLPRVSLSSYDSVNEVSTSSVSVKGGRGTISVEGCNDYVMVFMPNGMLTAKIHVQGTEVINGLQPGIYLVRISDKTYKVTVR